MLHTFRQLGLLPGLLIAGMATACAGQSPVEQGAAAEPTGTGGSDVGVANGGMPSATGGMGAGGEPTEPASECNAPSVGSSPLRRLTREQYDNSLRDLLAVTGKPSTALSPDEKITLFYSNAISPMTRLGVEQYGEVAEAVARTATTAVDTLVACDRAALGDAACATQFITDFGRRAFRRPLSDSEQTRYRALYDEHAARGFAEGIRLVLQAFLQSPHFLYHLEPAPQTTGVVPLDAFQLASRLSFALWNSTPDVALLDAAASGQLTDTAGLIAQATRLLDDPRARDALASFHIQWLGLEHLADAHKDATLFPQFDTALRMAMISETVDFVDHVIRAGDGRLQTLLSAPFTVADPVLQSFYGAGAPAADGTVALDPTQRAGLLTQAGFLAAQAHANQGSPVHRGLAVRKNLLCTPLPDPPANVNNVPPSPAPDATTRERFAAHTTDPTCAACHTLIDPIGFGFENYDAIGRYRTEENGLTIDASGELTQTGSTDGTFVGAVQLANKLAVSENVRTCVQKQWFRFALGRSETAEDACSMSDLSSQFAASDYNVKTLLIALISSDAFRYQKGGP